MKAFLFRVTVISVVLMALFMHVFADDSTDPSEVNKLLTSGEKKVTASTLLVNETFDAKSNWRSYSDDNVQMEIGDGAYHIQVKGDHSAFGLYSKSQTDTVIQVKATQVSEVTSNAYGVICRSSINGNGYYFLISGNGSYAIDRVEGTSTTLVKWTDSNAINQGQDENNLTVVCVNNYLALYVNDVLVAETTDNTFATGNPGLTVSGYNADSETAIDFDDARIWSASLASNTDTVDTTAEKPTSTELSDTLTSYAGKPKEAITELEQLGAIPSGSSLIFNERYAYFTGQGSWFTPLARRSPHKNIVMGGELTFTVGSSNKDESCSLSSRIDTNSEGYAITYVDIGIDNNGHVYVMDQFSETKNPSRLIDQTPHDLKVPHHLLVIMIDDRASVYVDGKLEIKNFKVRERSGTYGISLFGTGPKARCDGRNIWAFAVPSVKPGECVINATKVANKRQGPGTTFATTGQLAAGDEGIVSGRAKGADGKTWWQLDDETWVREDLVTAIGDCANIPVVKPG